MNPSNVTGLPTRDPASPGLQLSILHVPDCPLVARLRAEVDIALERVGTTAVIEVIEGTFRSPSLLIDGVEIDGYAPGNEPACRVVLPSQDQITSAIVGATARRQARMTGGSR